MPTSPKLPWHGNLLSVQPRIRLNRSFDERYHTYLGYVLFLIGMAEGENRRFTVAIGKGTHAKYMFSAGDEVKGLSLPVVDKLLEVAEYYKTSGIMVRDRGPEQVAGGPPFLGIPPALEVYRERGHRRLAARTYESKCITCIWGCKMPTEMIVDHWNPSNRRYRFETHCYGPLSCRFYKAGPTRKVPGRRGMQYEEEDWVDEQETGHRGPDE